MQAPKCNLPGCNLPCYYDKNKNNYFDFCGKTHAGIANSMQLKAPRIPQAPSIVPQQPSIPQPSANAPCLTPVNQQKYQDISNQFLSKWLSSPKPQVISIHKIEVTAAIIKKFTAYQTAVANQGVKPFGKADIGNTHRRFHGTGQQCTLGLNNNTKICSNSSCAVCSIIRNGWLLKFASNGNFGKGIYFTSTSSKSNGYNSGSETGLGSRTRSMFVASVVVGKAHKTKVAMSGISVAPNGCHSVIADPGVITDDEVIVYNEDAAFPKYFIVYKY